MFSWNKYLIVNLFFSYLGFWSENLFLIAPFPDLCLLVPFFKPRIAKTTNIKRAFDYQRKKLISSKKVAYRPLVVAINVMFVY